MTTISKFYFHDGTSANTGTLPGATNVSSGTGTAATVNVTASGASTNRDMDAAIGALQKTATATTTADLNGQPNWLRRFMSDPIAAQTISAQTITVSLAAAEANINSNYIPCYCLILWRPSTGAFVSQLFAKSSTIFGEAGTTQTAASANGTSTSATAQDGDILVIEFWRSDTVVQGMATAYTNDFMYDGTTEASATSCASILQFTNPITMFTPPATQIPRTSPYLPLLAQ